MFPFLAIFITFCLVLTYYIRKNDASQQKIDDEFWEKERLANTIRKKDISKLDYITIPFEKIPHKLNTLTEKKLFDFANKPMLNLTGISNTDLKLSYGTANITLLSEYDTNFTEFVALLPDYIDELLEANQTDTALMLLEFAVNARADSRKLFRQLANLYRSQGQEQKLASLWDASLTLPELTKLAIQKDLSSMN